MIFLFTHQALLSRGTRHENGRDAAGDSSRPAAVVEKGPRGSLVLGSLPCWSANARANCHHQQPPFSTHERGTVACIRISVGHGVVGNIETLFVLVLYIYARLSLPSTTLDMSSLPYCRGKGVARIDLWTFSVTLQEHRYRIYSITYTCAVCGPEGAWSWSSEDILPSNLTRPYKMIANSTSSLLASCLAARPIIPFLELL